MRIAKILTTITAAAVVAAPAFADLQNVTTGGEIRIRGSYMSAEGLGGPSWNDNGASDAGAEQRTKLNVTADFTNDVTAFIEMHEYSNWGSASVDTVPGTDTGFGGYAGNGVNLNQAYIETRETLGQPLTLRIGRQEVSLGAEFIVGNNDTAGGFNGNSFDGVTARYDLDAGSVTALALKVTEGDDSRFGGTGVDTDTDLYGLYGSYTAIENMVIDAYWFFARGANATSDAMELHTFGARVAGDYNSWDYSLEVAVQTGDDGAVADTDYSGWAADGQIGYTFDTNYQPRLWAGVAYFEGPSSSDYGFNRMFSDVEYSEFLGNTDMSNVIVIRGGASAQATESISVSGVVSYFDQDEDVAADNDSGIGVEAALYATYDYSEDLAVELGYAHFFADNDVEDGVSVAGSGTLTTGSGQSDDADYFYVETRISF